MNTPIDLDVAVKNAKDHLLKISPGAENISNFRLVEVEQDKEGNYLLTLSYDISGTSAFDKKRDLRQFRIKNEGTVVWMKVRKM